MQNNNDKSTYNVLSREPASLNQAAVASTANAVRRSSKKTNFSSSMYFSAFKPVLSFIESKNDIKMEEPLNSANSKFDLVANNQEKNEMQRKLQHEFYSQNFDLSSKVQRTSIISFSVNEKGTKLLEQAKEILEKNNKSRRISRMRMRYKDPSYVNSANLRMDSSVTNSNVMGILKPCSFSSDKKFVSRHKSMKGSKNSSKKVSFNRHRIVYKYSVNTEMNVRRANNRFHYDEPRENKNKSKFGRQNTMMR